MATPLRALLVLVALLAGAPAQAAELIEPAAIRLTPPQAPHHVLKAIRIAAAERGWRLTEPEGGYLIAVYTPRSHVARLRIRFDSTQVVLRYLDSSNLRYSEQPGRREIHPAYNTWVADLDAALQQALRRSDLETAEVPAAPVAKRAADAMQASPTTGPGRVPGADDTVGVFTRYADGVGKPELRAECDWLTRLPGYIGNRTAMTVVPATGSATPLQLELTVVGVHAAGGGLWSGPKYARLKGELREGSTLLGHFELRRNVITGHTACAAMNRLAEAIGEDIAAWLQNPAGTRLLGDLR